MKMKNTSEVPRENQQEIFITSSTDFCKSKWDKPQCKIFS